MAGAAADAGAKPLSIICFLFDPNVGGPTIRARAVYERMTAAGHTVRIAFPRGEGGAASYIAEAGIHVDKLEIDKPVLPRKPMAFLRFAVTFPVALWRVTAYLRRVRPDVVHVNGAYDLGPALGARLAGVPLVWHLNDTLFGGRLSRILGGFVRRVASRVVAAAGRVAEHYGVAGPDTMIIHAPVNVDRFAARDADGVPDAEPVIGLLANWNWIKGQDRFVEVIRRLRAEGRPVRGRMMGRFLDSQRDYWEPIKAGIEADPVLAEAIEMPGFVEDPPSALAGLDILLLTSHSEASPICVHEAMSIGVPQVVFDVGGVREMLGADGDGEPAGIVVPPGDVDAMVDAVKRLLDDQDLYKGFGATGQARARAHYSLEACVQRHETVYRRAVGEKG